MLTAKKSRKAVKSEVVFDTQGLGCSCANRQNSPVTPNKQCRGLWDPTTSAASGPEQNQTLTFTQPLLWSRRCQHQLNWLQQWRQWQTGQSAWRDRALDPSQDWLQPLRQTRLSGSHCQANNHLIEECEVRAVRVSNCLNLENVVIMRQLIKL